VPFDFAQDMLCVFARDSVFPLIADIKKQEYNFDPVSGEELQTLAKTVVNQLPQVIERVKKILGN
jgi:hypothetical protein